MPLTLGQYMRAATRLAHELNRAPLIEELADELDVPVAELLRFAQRLPRGDAVSALGPAMPEPTSRCSAAPTPQSGNDRPESTADGILAMRHLVERALQDLSPLERRVVRLRFGLDDGRQRSLDEVAALLRLPRARARELEATALVKLRRAPPPHP